MENYTTLSMVTQNNRSESHYIVCKIRVHSNEKRRQGKFIHFTHFFGPQLYRTIRRKSNHALFVQFLRHILITVLFIFNSYSKSFSYDRCILCQFVSQLICSESLSLI